MKSLSPVQLFSTPWTAAYQAPWDFPGKSTGVGCHCLLQVKLIKTESRVVFTLGVGRGEMGNCLMGVEFQFCKMVIIFMQQCAWKIPWMEEPGRLQSMGSQRVGND